MLRKHALIWPTAVSIEREQPQRLAVDDDDADARAFNVLVACGIGVAEFHCRPWQAVIAALAALSLWAHRAVLTGWTALPALAARPDRALRSGVSLRPTLPLRAAPAALAFGAWLSHLSLGTDPSWLSALTLRADDAADDLGRTVRQREDETAFIIDLGRDDRTPGDTVTAVSPRIAALALWSLRTCLSTRPGGSALATRAELSLSAALALRPGWSGFAARAGRSWLAGRPRLALLTALALRAFLPRQTALALRADGSALAARPLRAVAAIPARDAVARERPHLERRKPLTQMRQDAIDRGPRASLRRSIGSLTAAAVERDRVTRHARAPYPRPCRAAASARRAPRGQWAAEAPPAVASPRRSCRASCIGSA